MADIKHNQGEAGGYLVGRRHSTGGIKAVNKSTGQPLEMEGGEVVITRDSVSDPIKRSFNGKMMTNRQILSEINQSGGGVAFADGGELPETMHFDEDAEYEYGGDTMCGCDLATTMTASKKLEEGGETSNQSGKIDIFEKDSVLYRFTHKAFWVDANGDPQSVGYGSFIDLWNKFQYYYHEKRIKEDTQVRIQLKCAIQNVTMADEQDFLIEYRYGYPIQMKDIFDMYYDDVVEYFSKEIAKTATPEIAAVYDAYTQQYLVFTGTSFYANDFLYVDLFGANKSVNSLTIKTYDNPEREGDFRDEYPESVNHSTLYRDNNLLNFKRWEKFAKDVDKVIQEKGPTSQDYVIGSRVDSVLVSGNSGTNKIQGAFSIQIPEKDLSKTTTAWKKWDWWKENVLNNSGTFLGILENGPQNRYIHKPKLRFRNVNFEAYECAFSVVRRHDFNQKRSQPTRNKIAEAIEKAFENTKKVLYFGRGQVFVSFDALRNTTFIKNPRRYFDIQVLWGFIDPKGVVYSYDSDVKQTGYFFASDVAAFYFRGGEGWILNDDPEAREGAKKRAELAAAKAKAAKEAERKAQKEAEEAERLRKEELKKREWQVRDQPDDAEVWPKTFDSPEIIKAEKDLAAIGKLVTLANGLRNADMRRALLRKAQGIQKRLNNLKFETNATEQGIDSRKLNTPLGLISYYYNQARQSPVKRTGEPCGLSTPTGVPSKLDIQGYYAVRTTYFKKWFGDWEDAAKTRDYSNCSLLVDEDTKEPRIMYHGVRRFNPRVQIGAMGSGISRPFGEFNPPNFPATYFGDSLAYVEFYAGQAENQIKADPNYEGFIYSVFINMRNPIRLQGLGLYSSYKDLLAYVAIKYGIVIKPSQELLTKIQGENKRLKVWNYVRNDFNLLLTLKKAGYDGIIQYGDVPKFNKEGSLSGMFEEKEYLVFEPNQVKSAVVKKSFYLPQFNDIRFKDGGNVRI